MSGYKISFLDYNGEIVLAREINDPGVIETVLTGLRPYTSYRVFILPFNCGGDGSLVDESVRTAEGGKYYTQKV